MAETEKVLQIVKMVMPLLGELFTLGKSTVDLLQKEDLTDADVDAVVTRLDANVDNLKFSIQAMKDRGLT